MGITKTSQTSWEGYQDKACPRIMATFFDEQYEQLKEATRKKQVLSQVLHNQNGWKLYFKYPSLFLASCKTTTNTRLKKIPLPT